MKLTVKTTAGLNLPAGKSEAIIFDSELAGFGMRLREGGSRSWIFQYKIGEKQRRMTFGSYPALDATKAREQAEALHAKVKLGADPAGEKIEHRARASETFGAKVVDYLAIKRGEIRPSSYSDVERHLETHAKPLHGLQLAKIGKRDIAEITGALTNRGHKTTSNRVRDSLFAFFVWAMGEGLVDANPVINTNRNKEQSRDRVLSPDELQLIWKGLSDNDQYGDVIKLLALTGQRAGEIADLRWSEIDLDKSVIELPGSRTKNHRDHVVPISAPAKAILTALSKKPRLVNAAGERRDLVFGVGQGGFSGWSKCKQRLDARIEEPLGKALPHWTPHDLRRSAATHMAEDLGVQPHVIEAILNHVSGHKAGVAGTYNKATYCKEKKAALDLWAEWLSAAVERRDTNVTPLRRSA